MLSALLSVCFGILGGCLAASAFVVAGGLGGLKIMARRLTALEDEVQAIDERITREVKQRAGRLGAEIKLSKEAEAAAIVQELQHAMISAPQTNRADLGR